MYIYFNKCKAINKLPPRLVGKQKKIRIKNPDTKARKNQIPENNFSNFSAHKKPH